MTTAGGLRRELGTAFATKVLLAVFLAVLVFAAAAGASLRAQGRGAYDGGASPGLGVLSAAGVLYLVLAPARGAVGRRSDGCGRRRCTGRDLGAPDGRRFLRLRRARLLRDCQRVGSTAQRSAGLCSALARHHRADGLPRAGRDASVAFGIHDARSARGRSSRTGRRPRAAPSPRLADAFSRQAGSAGRGPRPEAPRWRDRPRPARRNGCP